MDRKAALKRAIESNKQLARDLQKAHQRARELQPIVASVRRGTQEHALAKAHLDAANAEIAELRRRLEKRR